MQEVIRIESKRYIKALEASKIMGHQKTKWLIDYKKRLDGLYNFAEQVDHHKKAKWRKSQQQVIDAELNIKPLVSWRDLPYI